MKQTYILTTALAVSLGVNATLISGGVVAQAAQSLTKHETISVNLTGSDLTAAANFIVARLCPQYNATFGVSDCAMFDVLKIGYPVLMTATDSNEDGTPDGIRMSQDATKAGSWVPGEPAE